MTTAYPLQWPAGWPRTQEPRRAAFGEVKRRAGYNWDSKRQISISSALDRLDQQLSLLRAGYPTISANLQRGVRGDPISNQREPDDSGVALYFQLNGKDTTLACDKWDRCADNIVAIAKHIEALRGMDRWGVGTMAQAFAGYQSLPAPEQWWQVLGVTSGASKDEINSAYRALAKKAHSDAGGSDGAMARLNVARDAGLAS